MLLFQKALEKLETEFEPLTTWMNEELKEEIEKAVVSVRLSESPCALVANAYGWSANMERVMKVSCFLHLPFEKI